MALQLTCGAKLQDATCILAKLNIFFCFHCGLLLVSMYVPTHLLTYCTVYQETFAESNFRELVKNKV